MSYPKLIGLTGFSTSGKDLTAALLKMVGYTRFGFADAVREEIMSSFDDGYQLPCMPEHIFVDWCTCSNADLIGESVLYEKPLIPQARRLLQHWGTEIRRKEDPDYWIKKLTHKLATYTSEVSLFPVVVSDVRFLNEASWVNRWDGVIWRIERPGLKSDGHQSENECNVIKANYTIHNDGDLQHLASQVLKGLEVSDGESQKSSAD